MKRTSWMFGATFLCAATAAQGLTLNFPAEATVSGSEQEKLASYALPIGPATSLTLPSVAVEGQVSRQAWHLNASDATTLQLLAPLRDQLTDAGFEPLFECDTQSCGGFDFRYGTEILPEPAMHVNLGDFRYFSARRTAPDGPEHLSLLVSRTGQMGFVHMVHVAQPQAAPITTVTASTKTPAVDPLLSGEIATQLESNGRVVLSDLNFETGSSVLQEDDFLSLSDLADYLIANPTRSVVLVGHTDAEGALEGNISLSKKRAAAVKARLIDVFGVPEAQIDAQGVGYLVPVASNLTDDGRMMNRRVEAILNSIE